ncbi:acyltransferase [Seonamhaeicola maritimus]|uniref:Acyltransferase n=2 Tax=Seonamhaeicola maritimus TaxID=2591822 RepID=A0A5C7GDA8_9FLAO|nr:acyltransferase [Seonamhaeicola maritimus]
MTTMPYLNNLTAFRGIAAILVALLHFHFFLGPVMPYGRANVIDNLYLMVDLFFILSGFIMCYVYEDSFIIGIKKKKYKNFMVARLARIYPLHIFTLLAEVGIFLFLIVVGKLEFLPLPSQNMYNLNAIPTNLVFMHTMGFHDFVSWNSPSWSLGAEWWAYVLFPFLFVVFKKLNFKNWFIGMGIALVGWLCIEFILATMEPFMHFPSDPNKRSLDVIWHFGTIRGIIGFIAGMSIWQIFRESRFKKLFGNGWVFSVLTVLALLSMHLKWYNTITVIIFAFMILSSAYGSKNIDRFFAVKILKKLGDWSFSIYLWHMVLINIILVSFVYQKEEPVKAFLLRPFQHESPVMIILMLVVFLGITSFVGWLSFKYIETPTRKWIRRKFAK